MPKRRRRERGSGSVFYSRTERTWIARFPLGRGRFKRARAKTELGAKQELERLRRAYAMDANPAAGPLDAYLADWLAGLSSVREATRVSYAGHINNHISPLLGGIPVARLRPADVRRLVADRLAAGLSPSTVRRIHSTLHAALSQGVRERYLADNAAHDISLPQVEDRLVEAMTEADADAIREAVKGTFLETLIEVLLGSGLRLGEALGLDQGDVHLGTNADRPDAARDALGTRAFEGSSPSGPNVLMIRRSKTRRRAVVISDDAAESLARHIAGLKVRGKEEPAFLGPRTGRRLNGTTVSHAFPKMLLDAGLARLTPHGTRHGVASLLLASGVHMKEVSVQLGHKSVSTTDRYYAHIAPAALERNVKLLNRRKRETPR